MTAPGTQRKSGHLPDDDRSCTLPLGPSIDARRAQAVLTVQTARSSTRDRLRDRPAQQVGERKSCDSCKKSAVRGGAEVVGEHGERPGLTQSGHRRFGKGSTSPSCDESRHYAFAACLPSVLAHRRSPCRYPGLFVQTPKVHNVLPEIFGKPDRNSVSDLLCNVFIGPKKYIAVRKGLKCCGLP